MSGFPTMSNTHFSSLDEAPQGRNSRHSGCAQSGSPSATSIADLLGSLLVDQLRPGAACFPSCRVNMRCHVGAGFLHQEISA